MSVRIGTYNVNNLFQRAKVLQLEGFSTAAGQVLKDVQRLNELLEQNSYAGAAGTKITALLEKYGFQKKNPNPWFTINEIRNKLFKKKKAGSTTHVELVAKGRVDWLGWVELFREIVPAASTDNTARVIQAVNADVLCVVEVEDRLTLDRFNDRVLKQFPPAYQHCLLIDGNDPRGIDVGLFSRFEIRSVRSHIDDSFTAANGRSYPIFSRDCAEHEVLLPSGKSLWMLCNHFKSKGYGNPADNDAKRKRQADQVRKILGRFNLAKDFVVVAGDFNDSPGRPPLKNLLQTPNLFDVLASNQFNGPRWTYQDAKDQIDFLLVSKALRDKLEKVGIERHGIFHATNFGGQFPHFIAVKDKVTQASDHAAVWGEFKI